jgi:Helix-turn-helix domain
MILRAMAKPITWWQAAEILEICARQMRRWKRRYEEYGYDGLYDRRRQRPLGEVRYKFLYVDGANFRVRINGVVQSFCAMLGVSEQNQCFEVLAVSWGRSRKNMSAAPGRLRFVGNGFLSAKLRLVQQMSNMPGRLIT